MAQSNLEYGGTTLEDLDKLDAARKRVQRPENLPRDRVEDNKELDRKPIEGGKDEKEEKEVIAAKDGEASKNKPFDRVNLKRNRKRETESPEEAEKPESANPFEEISTRSPPKDYRTLQQLRHRHRKNRRKRRRFRKNGFLTRDDIIKAKPNNEPPSVKLSDNTHEKAEFEQRNIGQETWERENKIAEEVREEMANNGGKMKKIKEEDPISPAQKLIDSENEELERRIAITKQSDDPANAKRLPNNPFRRIDISKPTIISLPVPPPDFLN